MQIGKEKKKGTTHKSGHMTPQWANQNIAFKITNEKEVIISVYEEDPGSADLVGETKLPIDLKLPGVSKTLEIFYKGQKVGDLSLDIEFKQITTVVNEDGVAQEVPVSMGGSEESAGGQIIFAPKRAAITNKPTMMMASKMVIKLL